VKDPEQTTIIPILIPAYWIRCCRCEKEFEYRCACKSTAVLGGPFTHLLTCRTTYKQDGGAIPNACPKCHNPKWLDPPAWRWGQSSRSKGKGVLPRASRQHK
jgi:hypothetical protein